MVSVFPARYEFNRVEKWFEFLIAFPTEDEAGGTACLLSLAASVHRTPGEDC